MKTPFSKITWMLIGPLPVFALVLAKTIHHYYPTFEFLADFQDPSPGAILIFTMVAYLPQLLWDCRKQARLQSYLSETAKPQLSQIFFALICQSLGIVYFLYACTPADLFFGEFHSALFAFYGLALSYLSWCIAHHELELEHSRWEEGLNQLIDSDAYRFAKEELAPCDSMETLRELGQELLAGSSDPKVRVPYALAFSHREKQLTR